VTSVAPAGPRAGSPDLPPAPPIWRTLGSRVAALSLVELQKLRHDRSELYTRAIQPALWLLIFGETFTRLRSIPTGNIPYLDYLAPGILAQSTLFMAIFYGIQIIWERDAGILTKLLVTPTPRAALIAGKGFAAGLRALSQVVVVLALSAILGVALTWNPLHLLGAATPASRSAARSTRSAGCCSARTRIWRWTTPCWSRRCSRASPRRRPCSGGSRSNPREGAQPCRKASSHRTPAGPATAAWS
jgi:hypothetical protein